MCWGGGGEERESTGPHDGLPYDMPLYILKSSNMISLLVTAPIPSCGHHAPPIKGAYPTAP